MTNDKSSAKEILAPELAHSEVPPAFWNPIPENAYEEDEERRRHINGEVQCNVQPFHDFNSTTARPASEGGEQSFSGRAIGAARSCSWFENSGFGTVLFTPESVRVCRNDVVSATARNAIGERL